MRSLCSLLSLILACTACSADRHRPEEAEVPPREVDAPRHEADAPQRAEPAGSPTLEYRFAVGDEFVYDTTDVARVFLFKSTHTEVEAVCPLAQRADGSWRLLFRWTIHIDGTVVRDVGRIDLMPDGRLVGSNPAGYRQDLGPWRQVPPDREGAERDGDVWRFRTETGAWAFDAARGRPVRVDAETSGDGQRETRTTTFREVVRRGAKWIRTAERESEDVIDTLRQGELRYRGARIERIESGHAAAKAALVSLLDPTTLPELRGPVEDALSRLEAVARARRKDAERLGPLLDVPSPSWRLKDLEGMEHALDDYKGSVVVLDFWESDCGFCIDAMPQVSALAERLKGRPAVVLGMNVSDGPKEARAVASEHGATYPTLLHAKRAMRDYRIDGVPTVVVLDKEGVVREYWSGYSPALADELLAIIEPMLE
jgi:thiol-disulfide isomerase/thioredoxin